MNGFFWVSFVFLLAGGVSHILYNTNDKEALETGTITKSLNKDVRNTCYTLSVAFLLFSIYVWYKRHKNASSVAPAPPQSVQLKKN